MTTEMVRQLEEEIFEAELNEAIALRHKRLSVRIIRQLPQMMPHMRDVVFNEEPER
jgi:hypothetical protein